jgi:[NiFe] hydrogenase diaphorase moiety large subunit
MTERLDGVIQEICQANDNSRGRLMDIVREVQAQAGCVSGKAMEQIAEICSCTRVEVESVVSFYSFLSEKPKGKIVIRLCNDPIDRIKGGEAVAKVLSDELGIKFGETTDCGLVTLEYTPCIGMCDQAPALLVNDVVVTNLTPEKAGKLVKTIMTDKSTANIVTENGDGNNGHELVKAMVSNNIVKKGEVIFADDFVSGKGLEKALAVSGADVVNQIKASGLRGRGGAGFPTGLKWGFTKGAEGDKKYVLCNADEGEPGTFKDRVLLTEKAEMLFEGMAIAGHAIGSDEGVLYLRGEYAYLRAYLEKVLSDLRGRKLLGKDILGKGFEFDIRIQMGAGAYICGEESSLISSCEGLRGDPKTRPPFPAQKGYNQKPTTVNNVETFCAATRIMEKGSDWYKTIGSGQSNGTKVMSVSGDVTKPGIYEVPFGTKLSALLEEAGAQNPNLAIMAGPSGSFLSSKDFERKICFDDLATGGALMVFNKDRDVLKIAEEYMEFFIEESCGFCTPCRVGNVLLKERLSVIRNGKGTPADLDYLTELGETVKATSRCGLGQTSPNPVLTTLKNFRSLYEAKVKEDKDGFIRSFDIRAQLSDCEGLVGRKSVKYTD